MFPPQILSSKTVRSKLTGSKTFGVDTNSKKKKKKSIHELFLKVYIY